jgi:hypothetical protein
MISSPLVYVYWPKLCTYFLFRSYVPHIPQTLFLWFNRTVVNTIPLSTVKQINVSSTNCIHSVPNSVANHSRYDTFHVLLEYTWFISRTSILCLPIWTLYTFEGYWTNYVVLKWIRPSVVFYLRYIFKQNNQALKYWSYAIQVIFYMNNRWNILVHHKQNKRDYVACSQENCHLSMKAHHLRNMDVKINIQDGGNFRIP